jgi:hypothetical protein
MHSILDTLFDIIVVDEILNADANVGGGQKLQRLSLIKQYPLSRNLDLINNTIF